MHLLGFVIQIFEMLYVKNSIYCESGEQVYQAVINSDMKWEGIHWPVHRHGPGIPVVQVK